MFLSEPTHMYLLKRSKSEGLLLAFKHRAITACSVGALPSDTGVNVQRVNFNYLGATALERLGRFYNVPEAHYGCPLDELAYAVATAFMREVPFSALGPSICKRISKSGSVHRSAVLLPKAGNCMPDTGVWSLCVDCSAKVLWRQLTGVWLAAEGCR